MRAKSSIQNLMAALVGQGIGLAVSFLARIVFLRYLNAEYLGINSLFSNILTILSLVELGVGPALTFSLYKPLSKNDKEKIKSLMSLYKKAYFVIGITILILGLLFTPFYRFVLDTEPNIPHITWIYFLFVLNTAVSYFYSYKRSLIISDQKRYIATIYRYGFYIVLNIVQIIVLIFARNYILFLICQILFTWLENLGISLTADRMYPYLKEKKVEVLDRTEMSEIKKNIVANMMHKVGGIIVSSTDNIIITKFVGLAAVGVYSNYYLVITALNTIISQLFNSVVAAIGNMGAVDERTKIKEVFYKTLFLNFWIYGSTATCLLVLFDDFIQLWLGKDYLFANYIVLTLVINFYLQGMRKTTSTFDIALGLAWYSRYKSLLEAATNLLFSLILVKFTGIAGVFMGTILSSVLVSMWIEPLILYRYVFRNGYGDYFQRFFLYTCLGIVVCGLTYFICDLLSSPNLVHLFILKTFVSLMIPNLIFSIVFYPTDEFRYYVNLLRRYYVR